MLTEALGMLAVEIAVASDARCYDVSKTYQLLGLMRPQGKHLLCRTDQRVCGGLWEVTHVAGFSLVFQL
jgi:hypothetical protein